MLRSLAFFRAETILPERLVAIPSEFAVLHNLLVRGLPTFPPLFVEVALTKLNFTSQKKEYGSLKFDLAQKGTQALDEFYTALHVADKRLQINQGNFPFDDKFDSDFERRFYYQARAACSYDYCLMIFFPNQYAHILHNFQELSSRLVLCLSSDFMSLLFGQ